MRAKSSTGPDNVAAWAVLTASITSKPEGAQNSLWDELIKDTNPAAAAIRTALADLDPTKPMVKGPTLNSNMSNWVATGLNASESTFDANVGSLYKGFLANVAAFEENNLASSDKGALTKDDKDAGTRLQAFADNMASLRQSVLNQAYVTQLSSLVKTAQDNGTGKLKPQSDQKLLPDILGLTTDLTAVQTNVKDWINDGAKPDELDSHSVASSIKTLQTALNNFLLANNSGLASLLKSDSTLGGFLESNVLGSAWLKSLSLWIDPKNQAQIGSVSAGEPLFKNLTAADQQQANAALSDLGSKLVTILASDEAARYDLVQDYLNQLYQINVQLYQEQERHYKAIAQVAQLETTRWTILQQINQNVSVTFDSLWDKGTQAYLTTHADQPHYFPFEGAKPADYTAATQPTAKDEQFTIPAPSVPGVAQSAAVSAATPTPVTPKTLRQAQVNRLGGEAVNPDNPLAIYQAWPPASFPRMPAGFATPSLDAKAQIFSTLRSLAITAKAQFTVDQQTDPSVAAQADALATDQRLKDLIKLLNNCLLMNAINLKFSLDDGRRLKQELMEHDLQLTELESSVKEANIQYRLDDLKIYHSGGITKDDLTALGQDAAIIFIASKNSRGF
jgi:hypothetical protein